MLVKGFCLLKIEITKINFLMNFVFISLRLLTSGNKEFEWAGSKASVIMTDAKIYATEPCSVYIQ